MKSLFITFEGIDGAGKTTQAKLLSDYIQRYPINSTALTEEPPEERPPVARARLVREPGGTPFGEAMRDILKKAKTPQAELMGFLGARADLVKTIIKPALACGEVVISDRFGDSSVAYQGYGLRGDVEEIKRLTRYAAQGLVPDITILLDIDLKTARGRLSARTSAPLSDRGGELAEFEERTSEFHERVRDGYLALAEEEPERWVVIDGNQPVDDVHAAIKKAIEPKLQPYLEQKRAEYEEAFSDLEPEPRKSLMRDWPSQDSADSNGRLS